MEKKEFIKQWMKTYEPDTFKAGENGRYFYHSEDLSSGIDLECFFEELLTDFESALAKQSEQQSNCNLPQVMPTLPLVLDQLDNWEWVVKCDGEIVYNAGMFEDNKKDALYWIYINANCYKRQ